VDFRDHGLSLKTQRLVRILETVVYVVIELIPRNGGAKKGKKRKGKEEKQRLRSYVAGVELFPLG
jgi:hypothetical protein